MTDRSLPQRVLSRRQMVFGLGAGAVLLAQPGCANAPSTSRRPPLRPGPDGLRPLAPAQPAADLVRAAGLTGALSFAVLDTASGALLEGQNPDMPLPPASVAKALTAAYALDSLGAGHRFRTRLIATGAVSGGVIAGDLVLAGGGDPVLDTDALADLAAALRRAGITQVQGQFLVYDGALPRINQIDGDQAVQAGYNTAIVGINLNFNRVHFQWTRQGSSYELVLDARGRRHQPRVSFATMELAAGSTPVYTFRNGEGRDHWTVARGALGNSGARWLPVRQPALYAGDVFRTLAQSNGIALRAPVVSRAVPQGSVVAEHVSDPLPVLLRDMLEFSTNITAEAIGLSATRARGEAPTTLAASAGRQADWVRQTFGLSTVRLVDHSGLGPDSRISAADMARFFSQTHRAGALTPLLRTLPMRDASNNIVRNHALNVASKTGTLNFVSALGGSYDVPRSARNLSFGFIAADLPRRAAIPESQRDAPAGTQAFNRGARRLQQQLLERWAVAY